MSDANGSQEAPKAKRGPKAKPGVSRAAPCDALTAPADGCPARALGGPWHRQQRCCCPRR
jgi:hypothetical protein